MEQKGHALQRMIHNRLWISPLATTTRNIIYIYIYIYIYVNICVCIFCNTMCAMRATRQNIKFKIPIQ